MYLYEETQLRVTSKYLKKIENRERFKKSRFIILEHLLEDTEQFVAMLSDSGASIFAVLAKPYSINHEVLGKMQRKYRIVQESYETLEETDLLIELMEEAETESTKDGRSIVIVDIGGYFAAHLTKTKRKWKFIVGVVEVTSFGHYRYQRLIEDINVPVFSVARSPLKEIESKFVGESAVTATELEFMKMGISLAGRSALVIGYGLVGENLARSLNLRGVHVSVFDKDEHKALKAFCDGFMVQDKHALMSNSDIIFSATGCKAISLADIEVCKNDVMLVSVGSKDTEFDIAGLKEEAIGKKAVSDTVVEYQLKDGKSVLVLCNGTAVNFLINGVQSEIMDLVMAEVLTCSILLLENPRNYKAGKIHSTPLEFINLISRDWLGYVNM